MKARILIAGGLVAAGAGWWMMREDAPPATGAAVAAVTMPAALSLAAGAGTAAFAANCASCHGMAADGRDGFGPPLIHRIYEPGHHGDIAFVMAVRRGVPAHHWNFGNMAPVKGVTDGDIATIIGFVREVQRANGID